MYPAGVYGPRDPAPGDGTKGLRDRLRYGWFMTTGGSVCVDVRDLATLFTKALAAGRGPRRYMAGGHFLTWAEEAALFLTQCVPCDSRRTIEELGVRFRPTAETLRDAIRWMLKAGHLEPRYAPRLAASL